MTTQRNVLLAGMIAAAASLNTAPAEIVRQQPEAPDPFASGFGNREERRAEGHHRGHGGSRAPDPGKRARKAARKAEQRGRKANGRKGRHGKVRGRK